ncbi:unnamed protein product, partial [Sphagnum jensenii]
PIGVLQTCFKEKFGIPRQPGLVSEAEGLLKLNDDPFLKTAIRELQGFSHLWLIFVFHQHDAKNWKPSIRPPRLGGARKVGVLASRSPHRPNPIGLSAVRILEIHADAAGGPEIRVAGVDILDGTPVLDIKPYLPYADSIGDAKSGWAEEPIVRTPVEFSEQGQIALDNRSGDKYPQLRELIVQILELDPRPAFQKRKMPPSSPAAEGTSYGFRLLDFDVKWKIKEAKFVVLDVTFYEVSRQFILKGVDGVVFVADSQAERMEANIESYESLEKSLDNQGYDLGKLPLVLQYNKRDLPDAVGLRELEATFNPTHRPFFEAMANRGQGVMETLQAISQAVIRELRG